MISKKRKLILILKPIILSVFFLVMTNIAIITIYKLSNSKQITWSEMFNNFDHHLIGLLVLVNIIIISIFHRYFLEKRELIKLVFSIDNSAKKLETIDSKSKSYLVQQIVDSFNNMINVSAKIKLEERAAERSKDEMITNISHDLRTPLTAIIGYLGLVESAQNLDEESKQKYIHTASKKAYQMKTLVEDLFEYSKTQNPEVRLNWTNLSVGDLLDQLASLFEIDAKNKEIEIITETNPAQIIMEGDSDKLARALMNLITNALKYAHGASYIKLSAKILDDEMLQLTVSNDGESIPKEAIDDLFNRFYRVESSRNNETGGTGLGLAIVKGIVEKHSGTVSAKSSEEETQFILNLPLKKKNTDEDKK